MKSAYVIGLLVISLALGFTLWSFSSSMSPYVDLQTARRTPGTVQVRGIILRDPAHLAFYDTRANVFKFWIRDTRSEVMQVEFHGSKPDAFDSAPGTAAHGMVRKDGVGREYFASDSMVVQCPSKYSDVKTATARPPKGGGAM